MSRPPRKRRTREHIIADLSVNHVERCALLCGHVVQRMIHDYGIDLELYTFTKRGEAEEGVVYLQLKASDGFRFRKGQATFPFRIARADLVVWLAQPMPVILIVYDAKKHVGYWLYVQSYFGRLSNFNIFSAGKTVTVHVALANELTVTAIRRFAQFRHQVLAQMNEVIHDEDHPV